MKTHGFVHRINPLRTAKLKYPIEQYKKLELLEYESFYQGDRIAGPLFHHRNTFEEKYQLIDDIDNYHEKLKESNKDSEEAVKVELSNPQVSKTSNLERTVTVHEIECKCLDCSFEVTKYYDKAKAMKSLTSHLKRTGHRAIVTENKITVYKSV